MSTKTITAPLVLYIVSRLSLGIKVGAAKGMQGDALAPPWPIK